MLQRLQQAWKLFHPPTIHRHLLMSEERHRQTWKCRPLPFCSGRSFHHPVLHRRSHLMAQFEQIKKQYAGYVLLFQVGDFYELYGEDASTWLVSGHIGNCRHKVPLMLTMCILFPIIFWDPVLTQTVFIARLCCVILCQVKSLQRPLFDWPRRTMSSWQVSLCGPWMSGRGLLWRQDSNWPSATR